MANLELDYMEYATANTAQLKYVSNASVNSSTMFSLTTDAGFGSGYTFRVVMATASLAYGGAVVRVVLCASAGTTTFAKTYFGSRGVGSIDFDGTQVPMTFNGSASVTLAGGTTATSDWVPYSFDKSKDLVVSFYMTAGLLRYGAAGGNAYVLGDDAANTTAAGGYSAANEGGLQVVYVTNLMAFSEATTKTQGSYSLKVVSGSTSNLGNTLTHVLATTQDLSSYASANIDTYSSGSTGYFYSISLLQSGGSAILINPTLASTNSFYTTTTAFGGATRNAITTIVFTMVNSANINNTFFVDNFYAVSGATSGAASTAAFFLNLL